MDFGAARFSGQGDSWIAQEQVIFLPRIGKNQSIFAEDTWVSGQAQQSLLGETAKVTDGIVRQGIKPSFRSRMMHVRVECQCEPDVNVGEKHLLRSESPRCDRRSASRCWADRYEPAALECAASRHLASARPAGDRKCSRQHLPATPIRLPIPPRHFLLGLE